MINSLEVINLPPNLGDKPGVNFSLRVGNRFTLEGKHLLLVGDNGVGKSTLLRALDLSFQINKKFQGGNLGTTSNPYSYFADSFSGNFERMSEGGTLDNGGDITKRELLDAIEESIFSYFGGNIRNLFLSGIPTSTKGNLLGALNQYIQGESQERESRRDIGDDSDVFGIAHDYFIDALNLFAKKYKIPLDRLYGGVLLMLTGAFPYINTEVTEWGYIVPKANDVSKLAGVKVITILDGQSKGGLSLGERTKGVIDTMPESGAVILLDEPTNGIDRTQKGLYRSKILNTSTGSQIIAASHDELFVDQAMLHENWRVVELPFKK